MRGDKIRIAFVVNDLGLGGVQRLVVDFANAFNKEKFDVFVVTLRGGSRASFYREELSSDVKFSPFFFKNFLDVKSWFHFLSFLRKGKIDIVFTQLFMADTIGRIGAWLARVPVIVSEIQNIIPDLPFKYLFFDRMLSRITNICISTTPAVTDYAVRVVGFPREKVLEVATNAVVAKRFEGSFDREKFRQSIGIRAGEKLIVNVGRLVEQKGQKILLDALRILREQNHGIQCVIVGSGYLKNSLEKEIKEFHLGDNVRLLGERKDIAHILMAGDVFAFPSLWEGQGLILFEAFFARIPIVASRVGGIPDVIEDGETGLLVRPGDSRDLAEKIVHMISDKALRERLTEEAFRRFKDRTIERAAITMEEVFEREILSFKEKVI
jgi:glycosyltransferase involved in cell wall biosynthesis